MISALFLIVGINIDGQVRSVHLIHLLMDNFCLFFETNGQMTNFHLQDEQLVDGLRKITWASILHLKWQHIYTGIHIHI
jgi:hypothetical protein